MFVFVIYFFFKHFEFQIDPLIIIINRRTISFKEELVQRSLN